MHQIVISLCVLLCWVLAMNGMTCNRYTPLCNKRFNEFCRVSSHNGSSYKSSAVQDQDRTITQQLQDGISATKIPVHLDYKYKLGYYHDMITAYLAILHERREKLIESLNPNKDQSIKDIEAAEQKIANLNQSITELERQINEKQQWYNDLSLWDKIIQAIPYNTQISALTTEKITLQATQKLATSELETAKQGIQAITLLTNAPSNAQLIALNTEIALVDAIRKNIIDIGGPDTFKQDLFACHGLYKNELYADHLTDLLNTLPENIRSLLEPIKNKLQAEIPNLMTKLFGTSNAPGGIVPFTPCLIDPSSIPLVSVLIEIKDFLDKNLDMVFTLVLEDATNGNWPGYEEAFNKSGIMHYTHTQDRNAPWPTLAEMIASDKRLVVFTYGDDTTVAKNYPWLNSFDFFVPWRNKWDYKTPQELLTSDPKNTIHNPAYRDNTPPHNKLFDIPHQVTPGLAGSKKMAAIVNAREMLRKRMVEHMKAVNHIVNIFSVDFYEYPSTDGIPDVIDVCDEINGVGKYEGKPLWTPPA